MLILHASDLQIGKPYRPTVAAAMVALAEARAPDLIVVAGDLTQRAKPAEYRTAREVLDSLAAVAPVVTTPGNHDVPLYRVWERLLTPFHNWRRWISPDLDTVTRLHGAVVVALSSAAPRHAIVAGRLTSRQVAFARRAFADAGAHGTRIVVTHHHFVPTPDHEGGRTLPRARSLLEAFEEMGVDLVLGGHVHQTHLQTSRALVPGDGPGIPLVACGTTASVRGRGPEAGENTLNVVRVGDATVEVTPHRYATGARAFIPADLRTFPRPGREAEAPSDTGARAHTPAGAEEKSP